MTQTTVQEKTQKKIQTRSKAILEVDGFQFKDLNGDGQLNPYEDWRLPAEERAKDLISRMGNKEKAGMFVLCDKPMGISVAEGEATSHNGIISEVDKEHTVPRPRYEYATSFMVSEQHIRHIILRENAAPAEIAEWTNALQEMCEETRLGIPMIVLSNSKNENLEAAFDADNTDSKFTAWPGTLGIAATHNLERIKEFAQAGYEEFLATGIRKGYMYMLDTATDPRWFRTYGTFGENPEQIGEIGQLLIETYQGEKLDEDSIALTIKHFPGGAARENGFDPHYAEGKFNVYRTEGSLENYHLPPFQAAIEKKPSSIMPYYAIPSNSKSHTPQAPFTGEFEEEVAFAYNKQFVQELLRDKMGFEGYINSDSGVLSAMAWGVEHLSEPERVKKALEAGTNIISGQAEVAPFIEAFETGMVSQEIIDARLLGTMKEIFQLGLFENPYVDVAVAAETVRTGENLTKAYQSHQESVVLLKNTDTLLPLTAEKVAGKKIYIELFTKIYNEKEMLGRAKQGIFGNMDKAMEQFPKMFAERFPYAEVTDNYEEADYAILFIEPVSGSYFDATPSYLELNILEETNVDLSKIKAIREAVPHVIMNVNFDLPFLLTNIEPMADALLAGFDTFAAATADVIMGDFNPTGKLPLSLPADDAAVAVDENGICASPNDVPGYDKEKYMGGQKYVYTDATDNRYIYGFGLTY